jgi:hypothetical protein
MAVDTGVRKPATGVSALLAQAIDSSPFPNRQRLI